MRPRPWLRSLALLVPALLLLAGCSAARAAGRRVPAALLDEPLATRTGQRTLVVAGGCFWGVQLVFQNVRGVISATAGYAGGAAATAHYDMVSTGTTGHAESVRIAYDPSRITLGQLLRIFFSVVLDPTELDRQGPDYGSQYRSVVFYRDSEQMRIAGAYIRQLNAARVFPRPIATELTPLTADHGFYPAEPYEQDFARRNPDNPYIRINDLPKLQALRADWPQWARGRP